MAKERMTIVLSDRAPVSIIKELWPRIANGTGDDWSGGPDGARHRQAELNGELTTYAVRVRRHADGRTIVYATREDPYRKCNDRAGGVILDSPSSSRLVATIREIGEACDIPRHVIDECIGDLPPEELDEEPQEESADELE